MKREQLEHLLRASANVLNDWSRTAAYSQMVLTGTANSSSPKAIVASPS